MRRDRTFFILSRIIGALLLNAWLPWTAQAQSLGILAGLLDPGASGFVVPRHAGKPDPRWTSFDWKYADFGAQPGRLRLYFYSAEEQAAMFAIPELRSQIEELKIKFKGYVPSKPFSYLLFNSHRGFRQTNVFNITEGVQGVTSTTEPVMAIPYWGQAETFRHISTHEMAHQFQVQKTNDLSEGHSNATTENTPLWFIEGMAEYYSLRGMDRQSRHYLRDLLVYPDSAHDSTLPKLFETGPMNFVGIYKVGQAKIDFLETRFGPGTAQNLLEASVKKREDGPLGFEPLLSAELKSTSDDLQKSWEQYIQISYKVEADALKQDLNALEEVKNVSDTIDHYDASPDGSLLITRELDQYTGTTSLYLLDLAHDGNKTKIDEDQRPGLSTLYFMQMPVLALSNHRLAYAGETIGGPEITVREINRSESEAKLGNDRIIKLKKLGMREASSLSISPDETRLAFVGLDEAGFENIYWIHLLTGPGTDTDIHPLTTGNYSYRDLHWTANGLLVASDQTPDQHYGLFWLELDTRAIHPVLIGTADLGAPDGDLENLIYQSWETGSSQIHQLTGNRERKLTEVKTAIYSPKLRGDNLFALGFKSGRFHLYRISPAKQLSIDLGPRVPPSAVPAWKPRLEVVPVNDVKRYNPFAISNIHLDQLSGFFGTGSVLGISAQMSDLMRDYGLDVQYASFGGAAQTSSHLIFTNRRGRTDWIGGLYYTSLPRLDLLESTDLTNDLYLNKEVGLLSGIRYPFGLYLYGEVNLLFAHVSRTDYVDPFFGFTSSARNPGSEWFLSPVFRLGRDRVQYEPYTGAISGHSLLLEAQYSRYFSSSTTTQRYRADGAYYLRLIDSALLAFQGVGGLSNGMFVEPFYVSSDDILRAYRFGDRRLIGKYLLGSKAELRFPIGSLFGFPYLRGLVGVDYGSVFNRQADFSTGITSALSSGLQLNFPPLSLGFIFSKSLRIAPGPPVDDPVFHFTLRYLYF